MQTLFEKDNLVDSIWLFDVVGTNILNPDRMRKLIGKNAKKFEIGIEYDYVIQSRLPIDQTPEAAFYKTFKEKTDVQF